MSTIRKNITVNSEDYTEFNKIAKKKGVKFSPWVNSKIKEFVHNEKQIESGGMGE